MHPHLATEWHTSKNGLETPKTVCGGKRKFWWIGRCGHEWKASLDHRLAGRGCPICAHHRVLLKDGTVCDSWIEAYHYLSYVRSGVRFLHGGRYPSGIGKCRYDFYFPDEFKYVEVTGYDRSWKRWRQYLRKIARKRAFVERNGWKFEFIQRKLDLDGILLVKRNIKS
jgi:hypothetical protein